MAKLSRREREKLERRIEILAASKKRFFMNTYDDVLMEDIANDVELAKGTLYLYFKNKQSLFFTIVIKGMNLLLDALKKAKEEKETGMEKILNITSAFFHYIQEHGDYYRLNLTSRSPRFTKMLMNDEIENSKEYIGLTIELLTLIKDAIAIGIKDGTLRKDLNLLQTTMFLGATIETAVYISPEYQILLKQNKITKEEYYHHSINMILHGIEGEKKIEK